MRHLSQRTNILSFGMVESFPLSLANTVLSRSNPITHEIASGKTLAMTPGG
jgi:hypothetical protein